MEQGDLPNLVQLVMVEVGFETKQVDPRVAKFTTTVKGSLLQAPSFKFMISRSQQFMRHPWHSSNPTFSGEKTEA